MYKTGKERQKEYVTRQKRDQKIELVIIMGILLIVGILMYALWPDQGGYSIQECMNETRLFLDDEKYCIKEKYYSEYATGWTEVRCYATEAQARTACDTGKY